MPDISEKRINEAINAIKSLDIETLIKISNKHIDESYLEDVPENQIRDNLEDFLYEDYSYVNPFIDALKRK